MTVADTSAWIDFSRGTQSSAARLLERCLADQSVMMPMPVLFEIFSGPGLTAEAREALEALPQLAILPGYWERAAAIRQALLKKQLRARAMDCLIAQACIDHDEPLIAADEDFRHFTKFGLQIYV